MDIRLETCVIIRKNGKYLVGRIVGTRKLRWSNDAYEAWRTRNREKSREVSRKVGGIEMLFNPVAGQLRIL